MHGSAILEFFSGGGYGAVASLDFDGSADYLSMSSDNFGAWQGSKLAVAGSLYMDDSTDRSIISFVREDNASSIFTLDMDGSSLRAVFYANDGTVVGSFNGGTTLSTGTWYSFLLHFNGLNSTSTDRIKLWVNNTAIVPSSYSFPTAQTAGAAPAEMRVGRGTNYYDGLIFSPAFFNGSLPTPAQIFDGSSGKLKAFSGLSGAQSWLDAGTPTNDRIRAANWTNNGTVAVNSSVP